MPGSDRPGLPPLRQRFLPLVVLFGLAPWIGEYLLGNVPGTWLPALPILALMYGGGAILVREIAMRAGLGWPGILLLGAAYGLLEAGLVDQSLFNPGFVGTGLPRVTLVAGLGISALDAVTYVMGHAVWSIGLAVAFAGFLFPGVAGAPWLGRFGWIVALALYLFGCWIIYSDGVETDGFIASPAQMLGVVAVALALAGLGFRAGGLMQGWPVWAPPGPALTGLLGFGLSTAMVLCPESWLGLGLKLAVIAVWAVLAWAMSRHPKWSGRHAVAFAGGILLTYAWLGPVLTGMVHGGGTALYLWNAVFALCAVALIGVARGRAAG